MLDQLCVSSDHWPRARNRHRIESTGETLIAGCVTTKVNKDNARAIRFYERKDLRMPGRRNVNPTSGAAVFVANTWRP